MKQAIIFDIDGTLLQSSDDDDRLYRQAVKKVLGEVRIRAELEEYEAVTDTGILQQILRDNDISEDENIVNDIKEEFFRGIEKHVDERGPFEELPGARSMLQRVAESGNFYLAIATGGWRRSAEMKLVTAGFVVDEIPLATSDDAVQRTDIMQVALGKIGASVTSITYFGDGVWDRRACEILGWNFRPVGPALDGISSYHNEFTIELSD